MFDSNLKAYPIVDSLFPAIRFSVLVLGLFPDVV